MPVTVGDIVAFRQQFPEFTLTTDDSGATAGANDGQITSALATADVLLDPLVWLSPADSPDFANARLYFAAHWLSLALMQAANSADGSGFSDLFVRQIRIGTRNIGFAQRKGFDKLESGGPGEAMLGTTQYGQVYLQLRARNITPVLVI